MEKIWKFTNPYWQNLEIPRFIVQRFGIFKDRMHNVGNLQILNGINWKFPDLKHKNFEDLQFHRGKTCTFPDILHNNLENLQIQRGKLWIFTNPKRKKMEISRLTTEKF